MKTKTVSTILSVLVLTVIIVVILAMSTANAETEHETYDKKTAKCLLTMQSNLHNVTKATMMKTTIEYVDAADIARQMKTNADRAKAVGYEKVNIKCVSKDRHNRSRDEYTYSN